MYLEFNISSDLIVSGKKPRRMSVITIYTLSICFIILIRILTSYIILYFKIVLIL